MGDKPGMIRLITVSEFADSLGVSPRTVAREINDGAITVVRVRGRVRIDPADAQAYISRQKVRREKPWPSTSAGTAGITDFRSAGRNSREVLARMVLSLLCLPVSPSGRVTHQWVTSCFVGQLVTKSAQIATATAQILHMTAGCRHASPNRSTQDANRKNLLT